MTIHIPLPRPRGNKTPAFPHGILRILSLTALLFLASGCSLWDRTAVLWTNIPEMAAYVESYNASHPQDFIEVKFQTNPGRALSSAQEMPDIVAGPFLHNRQAFPYFDTLEMLFEEEKLQKEAFYGRLLDLTRTEEGQTLLPLSFNMPVLFFNREVQAGISEAHLPSEGFTLDLEDISVAAKEFEDSAPANFTRRGFSPLWFPAYMYQLSRGFHIDFQQNSSGSIIWNSSRLTEAVESIRSWVEEYNNGSEAALSFEQKYLYDPPFKLVNEGRILLGYAQFNTMLNFPPAERELLDFQWISRDGTIPVLEDMHFIGIPKEALNKDLARRFLTWLFTPETQSALLTANQVKHLDIFGIAGGFSTLKEVNELELPKFFPFLVGKIPASEYLLPPGKLPENWNSLRTEVVIPWIEREVLDQEQEELGLLISEWFRQQPF